MITREEIEAIMRWLKVVAGEHKQSTIDDLRRLALLGLAVHTARSGMSSQSLSALAMVLKKEGVAKPVLDILNTLAMESP
jgi:pyocin large subunit-like protein